MKPKILFGGLVLVVLLGVVWMFGARWQAAYYDWQAQRALRDNRPERAVQMLQYRMDHEPGNAELRLQMVDLYWQIGNFTRVEYLLAGGMEREPENAVWVRKLCQAYVQQDKLFDAVELLDSIDNPALADQISRPEPPVLQPPPGRFERELTITVSAGDDNECYVNFDGDVPSREQEPIREPVSMSAGQHFVQAVAVNAEGLVSSWSRGEYTLTNVLATVTFADPAIESLVRTAIEKPEGTIQSHELWDITELRSDQPLHYRTLVDLQWLTGLTDLSLIGDDTEVDLSVLPSLQTLRTLSLTNFHVDALSLENIGVLENVHTLALPGNWIASLSALAPMTNLRTLLLSENSITDISPLAELTQLTVLDLSHNAVDDTMPLESLTSLRELYLSENRVVTLPATLTNMEVLTLDHNRVGQVTSLAGMKALRTLDISYNPDLTDLSPLGGLSSLALLQAKHCAVESIEALDGLSGLTELDLSYNMLTGLTGAQGLTALTKADFSRNQIAALDPLAGLPELTTLHIENNNVSSLTPLSQCPKLKSVHAFGNTLTETISNATVFRE